MNTAMAILVGLAIWGAGSYGIYRFKKYAKSSGSPNPGGH